jgi:hypothetical protein
MGMLQGALIGLIVGGVMAYLTWQKNKKRGTSVLLAFASGGKAAALKALNEATPAMPGLKANHLVAQQERMAGLAIIGDTDSIMQEIKLHRGKLNLTAQVHGIALLGARVRGVKEASGQLNELATKMEQEGGALMGAVKTKLRTFANLAAALDDTPLPPEAGTAAHRLSASEGPMARLVVMAALAKATERFGGDARVIRSKIRESTKAFDS